MKKPNHSGTKIPFIKKPHRLLRHVSSARKRDLENLVHADQQYKTKTVRYSPGRPLSPTRKPQKEVDPALLIHSPKK
ncbi:hypothetical protein KUV50_13105 [Membranicola marinus]|uniref:Uncharacterized protein n=1 Tax=Membranihabitans marinus TaxID=1227546 RepID=A0A953LAV7_9BACT|nr:hypothetical protein [Membranihabitans marinus]MBY5959083.1 hypothetical protein [Membranihabitans marinus]